MEQIRQTNIQSYLSDLQQERRPSHKRLVLKSTSAGTVVEYRHVNWIERIFARMGFGKANFSRVVSFIKANQWSYWNETDGLKNRFQREIDAYIRKQFFFRKRLQKEMFLSPPPINKRPSSDSLPQRPIPQRPKRKEIDTKDIQGSEPQKGTHQYQLHQIIQSFSMDSSLFEESPSNRQNQQKIGKILQEYVLPIYKTPMPRIASYRGEGAVRHILRKTSLGNYQATALEVKDEKIPARSTHGTMHAARVTLWTQVLIHANNKLKNPIQKDAYNPIFLATAGGMHDAAREDEGVDYWDSESADLLTTLLTKAKIDSNTIPIYDQTIREKDPVERKFTTIPQQLVHDADCLEIIRCYGRGAFRQSELCLFAHKDNDPHLFNAFIDEVATFIERTDSEQVRNDFEHGSADFYGDLIRMLFQWHAKTNEFPLITSWIREEMEEVLNTKRNK